MKKQQTKESYERPTELAADSNLLNIWSIWIFSDLRRTIGEGLDLRILADILIRSPSV